MSEQIDCFLEFAGVTLKRDGAMVFNNLSFPVARGEFVVIAGNDTGGKTSFLKLAAGLIAPTAGTVKISGRPLSEFSYREYQEFRHRTGWVFQNGVLVSNLSIKENIALPLRYHLGLRESVLESTVTKYLESFNLLMYANERPAGLPLEVRLMTNLARALVVEPELLLLDEFFAELGPVQGKLAVDYLKRIKGRGKLTCLATTNLVNLLSYFPEEPLVDCLMTLEEGTLRARGTCSAVREQLKKNLK